MQYTFIAANLIKPQSTIVLNLNTQKHLYIYILCIVLYIYLTEGRSKLIQIVFTICLCAVCCFKISLGLRIIEL